MANTAISQVVKVAGYLISETDTIRSQDLRRFAVTKPGRRSPYIVTLQAGFKSGCSCIAGRNQKECKHVAFVRSVAR
jgi:hypothetical protein